MQWEHLRKPKDSLPLPRPPLDLPQPLLVQLPWPHVLDTYLKHQKQQNYGWPHQSSMTGQKKTLEYAKSHLPKYFSSCIWSLLCYTLCIVRHTLSHYLIKCWIPAFVQEMQRRLFSQLPHNSKKFHGWVMLSWERCNSIHLSIFIIKIVLI